MSNNCLISKLDNNLNLYILITLSILTKGFNEMKITVTHSAFEKAATDVAIVKIPSHMNINQGLEYAYRWTQNVYHGWSIDKDYEENEDANKDVEVHYNRADGLGHRSTSVGDILTVHDDYIGNIKFKVMPVGFEEVRELAY